MARGYRFGVVGNLSTVPDGRTVTPINDVSILLQCAGIQNSSYTTLTEIFNDTEVLNAVINSNNAIDYLVRSTTFAKQEALVPTMTSDTTPSGTAFMEDEHSTAKAYKAFDKDNTTTAQTASSSSSKKIGYQFPTPVKIYRADYYVSYGSAPSSIQIKVCHSNDGTNYTDDTSLLSVTNGVNKVVPIQPSDAYKYWRIDVTISDNKSIAANEIQFYSEEGFTDNATAMTLIGANNYASDTLLGNSNWRDAICNSTYFESVLNAKVPVMTSNTTPSGECSASSNSTQGIPYRAFDGQSSTGWISNTKGASWIQYQFPNTVKFCMVTKKDIYVRFNTFKMQTSTDGTTWDDVTGTLTNSLDVKAIVDTVKSCRYIRLQVLSNSTSYNDGCYGTTEGLQFYCRVDV